jgi:hypothetical protein
MTVAGAALWAAIAALAVAPDLHGRVVFSGVAVPGAVVSVTQHGRTVSATSDEDGAFAFDDLDPGVWTLHVEMRGFARAEREVTVPAGDAPLTIALKMSRYEEIVRPARVDAIPAVPASPSQDDTADPLPALPDIVNGSVVNAAASPFAQPRAFGNNRPGRPSLYNGSVNATFGNSAWNARPFTFGDVRGPVPAYGDTQIGFSLGGPLRIPSLVKYGPQTFVAYQHGDTHAARSRSALVPTPAERHGDLSALPAALRDPLTGEPFPGNVIPADRIAPQASALAAYYPLPNSDATAGANYQTPLVTATRQDVLQVSLTHAPNRGSSLTGTLAFQHNVVDATNLFRFKDTSRLTSWNAGANWFRRLSSRATIRLKYQFTRDASAVTPFFANRANVSGDAGISGNNQDPENWGPPSLVFASIAELTDAQHEQTTRTVHAAGAETALRRGLHNITVGGDVRAHAVDLRSQQDPRGTLTFTGALTGNAFGDFLLGVPATSAIASGDGDTRLRAASYDAYVNDDWRIRPNLTLNAGVRWEFESPFTETSNQLVNLEVGPGFSTVRPVTASAADASLIAADWRGVQPRVAISWRPSLGSALVVRAGYGIYRSPGVYESLARLLAEQPPFSKTFRIQNSREPPLTLAQPFSVAPGGTTNTFAVDAHFRSAAAQTWQASVQRELPASLTLTAAYLGTKGGRLIQASLPNTFPPGGADPCPSCPSGFVYAASGGHSLRNAAQVTLRRRLHAGLTATAQYTLAKSTDDAATFADGLIAIRSLSLAQDWRDLEAEQAASGFDQRHLLAAQVQYTTGMGLTGGTLVDGVKGALFKNWTIAGQLTAGSGLPVAPVSFLTVAGSGVVGVRPMLTGASTEPPSQGTYANPGAYTAPAPGTWGDAGRNSIRGPATFGLDATVARALHLRGRVSLEWRLAATNALNHVTFAAIDTVIASPQFGRPTQANPMRALQMSLRLRF